MYLLIDSRTQVYKIISLILTAVMFLGLYLIGVGTIALYVFGPETKNVQTTNQTILIE